MIRAITFDVGGVIFSDDAFKRAIFRALQQLQPSISQVEFDQIYWQHLSNPDGSLRNKLTKHFLKSLDRKTELMELTNKYWKFNTQDLYQDAKSVLQQLKRLNFKIGIIANQPASVVDDLARENLLAFIDALAISAIEGVEKPNLKLFEVAIARLETLPQEIVHVGNRIDTDVIPAKTLGMKTVWVRRGEANPNPSEADFKTPNLIVDELIPIPNLIKRL